MATQTQVLEAPVATRKSSGLWRDAFGRLVKNRLAIVGLILVALFALVALFGPWLAPYPYQQQDVAATAPYHGPIPPLTDGHVLGTSGGYAVVDVPEAIWSGSNLIFLAHEHIPTVWDRKGIRIERGEWTRKVDGVLEKLEAP